jgi:hypothetical protein
MKKCPTPMIFGQYSRVFGSFLLFLALSPDLFAQESQPDLSAIDKQSFTLVGIPVAALISGGITAMILAGR